MRLLMFALLILGSHSVFAKSECDDSLNRLVKYTESVGQLRTFVLVNETKISLNKSLIKLLDANPGVEQINGLTRVDFEKLIKEDTKENASMNESISLAQEIIEELKVDVKESCK